MNGALAGRGWIVPQCFVEKVADRFSCMCNCHSHGDVFSKI